MIVTVDTAAKELLSRPINGLDVPKPFNTEEESVPMDRNIVKCFS